MRILLSKISLAVICLFPALATYAGSLHEVKCGNDELKLWTHEDVLKYISPSGDFLTNKQCQSNSVACVDVTRQRILDAFKKENCTVVEKRGDIFSITNLIAAADTIFIMTPKDECCRISVYACQDINKVLSALATRLEEVYDLWSDIRVDYLKQHRESQFVLYEKNLLEVVYCSDEGVVVIVRDSLNGKSRGKGEVKSIVEKVLRAIVPRSKDVGMGGDGQVDSSDGGGYRGDVSHCHAFD